MGARQRRTIGVFDSGIGGLTVVRALRRALPSADLVYLGDTARVPYGSKGTRTVERYSLGCTRFLLGYDVDLVVVACNTASALALPAVREASPVPVIGAVGPGADSALAVTSSDHIGVIGTLATVRSGAYERALHERKQDVVVRALACPLFVPLAEEGWTEGEVTQAVVRHYLSDLLGDRAIDTLVLGCTHYPLLAKTIAAVAADVRGSPVAIVDSATAMATAATALATDEGEGRLRCFVTDATRMDELAPRFLGHDLGDVEVVDL